MNDYEKMKSIIDEADNLISLGVEAGSPEFQAWKNKTLRLLMSHYGEESFETKDFLHRRFSPLVISSGTPDSLFVEVCIGELKTVKAILLNYLEEMKNDSPKQDSRHQDNDYSKVFIVHGHDGELRESVARLVEKQGIRPIILKDQPNRGATIIEKFESNSDTAAAICLFTADDDGAVKGSNDYKSRARQNVVFEAGFFMGKLSREKTIIVANKEIEIPSDLQGVVYTDTNNWKFDILKELKAIGYRIDYNLLDE